MNIKFKIPLLLVLVSPMFAIAQPVIKNAEDFQIGTVLKFKVCDTGVSAGSAGDNQTWDFSGLKQKPDTVTEWMMLPSETPYYNKFSGANQVEKYSGGSYVYVNKQEGQSSLVGYANAHMAVAYPKPVLFVKRPITYKSTFTDTFLDNFTSAGMNFSGSGTVTIEADGYGQLILPNKTYKNVLRVKITQIQTDTVKPYNTFSIMGTITYAWFDGVNTSALLKISITKSTGFNSKKVEYLLSEENK